MLYSYKQNALFARKHIVLHSKQRYIKQCLMTTIGMCLLPFQSRSNLMRFTATLSGISIICMMRRRLVIAAQEADFLRQVRINGTGNAGVEKLRRLGAVEISV